LTPEGTILQNFLIDQEPIVVTLQDDPLEIGKTIKVPALPVGEQLLPILFNILEVPGRPIRFILAGSCVND